MSNRTEHVITTAEIRESWTRLMTGNPGREHELGRVTRYAADPDHVHEFAGMSGRQIATALNEGFYPDADMEVIGAAAYGTQEVMVPQVMVNEEFGELLIDQALAGEDEFYVTLDQQPMNVGVDMRIQFDTNGDSEAHVLGSYFEWCLHVIDALERKGVSPSVTLTQELNGTYVNDGSTRTILIPLVEEGEVIDPVTWRAFMTKGAFRTLGFTSIGLLACKLGKRTTLGLGSVRSHAWGVEYDREDGTLTITCPGDFGSHFPADDMTEKLSAILEQF